MAFATINKGASYFNTVLYAGASGTQAVTGVGFKPDFVWIKNRSITADHQNYDIIRGTGTSGPLSVDSTDPQGFGTSVGLPAQYGYLSTIGSDGFTAVAGSVNGNFVNSSGSNYASWNWLASNTTTSNTNGSISSTISVNTTAGFSIVSYTGSGSAATVGHGLGVAPKIVIIKNRNSATNWSFYSKALVDKTGNSASDLILNGTNADLTDASYFNSTAPTSTVFSIGSNSGVTGSGNSIIAYCFAEIKGFSKFGSYTGNGSTDGTFIYTGFKPAFVIIKQTSSAGEGWEMGDNKRSTYNVITTFLRANSSAAESTNTDRQYDFVSNGIKMRGSHGSTNGSGSTYIYMCFAENPFVLTDGTPVTAR
jgi:hypothetical protein